MKNTRNTHVVMFVLFLLSLLSLTQLAFDGPDNGWMCGFAENKAQCEADLQKSAGETAREGVDYIVEESLEVAVVLPEGSIEDAAFWLVVLILLILVVGWLFS